MRTEIAQTHVAVTPGMPTRVEIDVTNTSDVIDGVTAIVDGINPDWVRLERPLISLFPETTDRLAVIFDIPRSCPAGDYLVVVRVMSAIDPERYSVHDFWLAVGVVEGVAVELRPSIVTGGRTASFEAIVVNTGNAPAEIAIAVLEPTRVIDCRAEPSRIVLAAGAEAALPVLLKGPRPWIGQPAQRQIHVGVSSGPVAVDKVATFNQRPRIPRGVITALVLASIIALWALIFLWVISEMRSEEPPAKAVGTDLNGPANIALAAIAGEASGRVTAATNGEGISRITVEAFRVKLDGSQVSVASAATDDEGRFVLPTLIPGDYRFRFTADGYVETWYTRVPTATGEVPADPTVGSVVNVGATDQVTGIDVTLAGEAGSLTGRIALPPGSEGAPLTVRATLVTDVGAGAAPGGATVDGPGAGGTGDTAVDDGQVFTQVTTDGTINLDGLPTPGTYRVTVTGDGFETQSFEASVAGGRSGVLDTVTVEAADGRITGLVVDGANNPLGGVEVVARAGDTEVRAVTPTTGNVGAFELIGLPSPETYVLTFARDGYSGQTKALNLAPGATESVQAQLIGGSGTVTGEVVAADGTPLGGVTVSVSGDGFTGQTTTLTTSGGAGSAGSYSVTGLPVPGVYTITFSADGYQSETLGAGFLAAGAQHLGSVVLLPETGSLRGVVRSGGGLGEVTITITDGTLTRTTTSATAPAGEYAFTDLPAGWYAVTFARPGYATRVVQVEVLAGFDVTQDVELTARGGQG